MTFYYAIVDKETSLVVSAGSGSDEIVPENMDELTKNLEASIEKECFWLETDKQLWPDDWKHTTVIDGEEIKDSFVYEPKHGAY